MTLPIKDTMYTNSLQRTLSKAPKIDSPIVLIHFSLLKSGQPLYSGQISWSKCVLYKEVPPYIQDEIYSYHHEIENYQVISHLSDIHTFIHMYICTTYVLTTILYALTLVALNFHAFRRSVAIHKYFIL